MWKYFTLCREIEVGLVIRGGLTLLLAFTLTGCVAGPTPHPAETDPSEPGGGTPLNTDSEYGASDAASVPNASDGDLGEAAEDVDLASDSDAGPDVGDTASDGEVSGDTATDGPQDTATDGPHDTATDDPHDAPSGQGEEESDE